MLSGLGPADHLASHGIPVVADLPGVGENLQDHLDCYTVQYKNGPDTYYGVEAGGFATVDPQSATPDIQLHFLPAYVVDHGMMRIPGYGVCLYTNLLRPRSRGTVRLASGDPAAAPLIDPNYLADPHDRRMAIEGLKFARDVMSQPAFRPFIDKERMPGPAVRTDEELHAYVRQWAKTDYHPVGTCKMGTDPLAVVSPRLAVKGIERLRICDSSVMPSEISANTNAPTIMIAERAAEMILADAGSGRAA